MIIALWPPRLLYRMQTLNEAHMHGACRLLCRSRSELTTEKLNEKPNREFEINVSVYPYCDLSSSQFFDTQLSNK